MSSHADDLLVTLPVFLSRSQASSIVLDHFFRSNVTKNSVCLRKKSQEKSQEAPCFQEDHPSCLRSSSSFSFFLLLSCISIWYSRSTLVGLLQYHGWHITFFPFRLVVNHWQTWDYVSLRQGFLLQRSLFELTGDPFILKTNGRGEKSTSFSTLISAQTQSQDSFFFFFSQDVPLVRCEKRKRVPCQVNDTRDDDSSEGGISRLCPQTQGFLFKTLAYMTCFSVLSHVLLFVGNDEQILQKQSEQFSLNFSLREKSSFAVTVV